MARLLAAPFTPMGPDGTVLYGGIRVHAGRLMADGIHGAFVCGTSGEGLSLSVDERRRVLEEWVSASRGGLELIAHVGCQALPDAMALAGHAQGLGVAGISAMLPGFFKPSDLDGAVEWCRRVAAAAPDLPFYYYHFPLMTGLGFGPSALMGALARAIPTFAGAKYTAEDLVGLRECMAIEGPGGPLDMLLGREELLMAGLSMGVKGAIGSTFTFAGGIVRGLVDAFDAGDTAKASAHQDKLQAVIAAFRKFGSIAPQKAILDMMGLQGGPPRPPLSPLGASETDGLRKALAEAGFVPETLQPTLP